MLTTRQLRQSFLDFFSSHAHKILPSSPLIPHGDESLLFTNAGMVPFKRAFMGAEPAPAPRITTCQTCVRAGGKHNDLDNVGYTPRHHTLFEMLGNFSFGDYGKADAIGWAWQLLTQTWGIDKNRLWITVHAHDQETADLWPRVTDVSKDHICRLDSDDNFWAMGETGPCGYCTEIYYDYGPHLSGSLLKEPSPRFVEIWNLVFMAYEQQGDGTRTKLPHLGIDTGMGLERIATVLQGKEDNFDTDDLRTLIEESARITGHDPDGPHRFAHRVIVDHARSASFLIADGVLPGSEGRDYVLRRIIRRALRYAHELGKPLDLLPSLALKTIEIMGDVYPRLRQGRSAITENLSQEANRFNHTLERGLCLLKDHLSKNDPHTPVDGKFIFTLYDTYGFPVELAQDILRENNLSFNEAAFQEALQEQRHRSQWSGTCDVSQGSAWPHLTHPTVFEGYNHTTLESTVVAVDVCPEEKTFRFAVEHTPFYAESGGQVADQGKIFSAQGFQGTITDVQHDRHIIVHKGTIVQGTLNVGERVTLMVDTVRRDNLRRHHSATHLLHAALRNVLGTHVVQKGSLVEPHRLRFDFSHAHSLNDEILRELELWVNEHIWADLPVSIAHLSLNEALEKGAMALFGEKYPDTVRTIHMGQENAASLELCGGTHVQHTGQIGPFFILKESSVGSGIRRIEAVAGPAALQHYTQQQQQLQEACACVKTSPHHLNSTLMGLQQELAHLTRQNEHLHLRLAFQDTIHEPIHFGQGTLILRSVTQFSAQQLRQLVDLLKDQAKHSSVVFVINTHCDKGKMMFCIGLTQDLTSTFDAAALARKLASFMGNGSAGGRKDFAQGGADVLQDIEEIKNTLVQLLSQHQ